jgi:hypothetical protein
MTPYTRFGNLSVLVLLALAIGGGLVGPRLRVRRVPA